MTTRSPAHSLTPGDNNSIIWTSFRISYATTTLKCYRFFNYTLHPLTTYVLSVVGVRRENMRTTSVCPSDSAVVDHDQGPIGVRAGQAMDREESHLL